MVEVGSGIGITVGVGTTVDIGTKVGDNITDSTVAVGLETIPSAGLSPMSHATKSKAKNHVTGKIAFVNFTKS